MLLRLGVFQAVVRKGLRTAIKGCVRRILCPASVQPIEPIAELTAVAVLSVPAANNGIPAKQVWKCLC